MLPGTYFEVWLFQQEFEITSNLALAPASMAGVLASENGSDSIYYNVGYKSYKITRLAGEESWFEWT